MKKLSDLLDDIDFNIPEKTETNFYEHDAIVINNLFACLQSIFPAFKQAWPNDALFESAKKEWIKAFSQVELNSIEKIKFGISKFRMSTSPFVPTPGQFIAMCNPTAEDIGLPSSQDAYREACLNSHPTAIKKWTHPAIYHAWKETGAHELSNLSQQQSKPIFERNYEITIRMILDGKTLQEIPLAIKHGNMPMNHDVVLDEYKSISDSKSAFAAMMAKLK